MITADRMTALAYLHEALLHQDGRVSFERNGAEVVIRITEFRDRTIADILAMAQPSNVVPFRKRDAA